MAKVKREEVDEKILSEDVYAAEDEEGKTPEELESEMEEGLKEEEVYTKEGREKLIEDAEIEPWEEGFMEGAERRGEQHCCAYCGALLGDEETEIYEREFDGDLLWFCSAEHAQRYAEKLEKRLKKGKELEGL